MDDIFEELYYQFVYLPKKDACPERTGLYGVTEKSALRTVKSRARGAFSGQHVQFDHRR